MFVFHYSYRIYKKWNAMVLISYIDGFYQRSFPNQTNVAMQYWLFLYHWKMLFLSLLEKGKERLATKIYISVPNWWSPLFLLHLGNNIRFIWNKFLYLWCYWQEKNSIYLCSIWLMSLVFFNCRYAFAYTDFLPCFTSCFF